MSALLYLITGAGGGAGGVSRQVLEQLSKRPSTVGRYIAEHPELFS
jgi:hypothetical protein